MLEFCQWLEQTPVGASVRQSLWLFPILETLHLLGMTALLGVIGTFDLRLLGWVLRRLPVAQMAKKLLPWAWAGFSVQVVTGGLLFTSEAVKLSTNPAFRIKLLLIALAGVHGLVFHHWTRYGDMQAWDDRGALPLKARVAGLISLLLWAGVVAAGRWIGFV
jgi:hypothetical protein